MAGQGQGMLQPTKLILSDDFHDNLAQPGYATHTAEVDLTATNGLAITELFQCIDGNTYELLDAGITITTDVDDNGGTSANIKFGKKGDDDFFVTAATIPDTTTKGTTLSVLRGSTGFDFVETGDVSNALSIGAGEEINVTVTAQGTAGGAGNAFVWVKVKYKSRDFGAI
jgi:hypothetical protein